MSDHLCKPQTGWITPSSKNETSAAITHKHNKQYARETSPSKSADYGIRGITLQPEKNIECVRAKEAGPTPARVLIYAGSEAYHPYCTRS